MYYFKSDMSGLYLTLKVPYKGTLKNRYGDYYSIYLTNRSKYIREFLIENNKIKKESLFEIDLGSSTTKQRINKKSSIVAKYYDRDNIPSDEELIADINYFLELREFILNNYTEQIEPSEDEWVSVLENKSVIDEKMFSILTIIYHMDNFSATTAQLIEKRRKLGFLDEKSYNSTIIANSRRVKEFLNKNTVYNEDGSENFWMRFFYGKNVRVEKGKKTKAFQFRLKKDVIGALGRVNRIYSGEETIENEYQDNNEIIETEEVDDMVEEKLFNSFYDYLLYKGYFFDKETIENYLLSLKAKPFTILTGNSGTGKTKLSQLFAQYMMENREIGFVDDYISVKVPIGINLKENSLQFTKKVVREILDLYQYEGKLDISFNGIKSKESIGMFIIVECKHEKVLNYLNSNNFAEIDVKIKKQDIKDSFVEIMPDKSIFTFKRNVGINYEWTIPKDIWSQFIPIKSSYEWNIIIDGIPATAKLNVWDVRIGAMNTKNTELNNYLNQLDVSDSLNIEIDLSTFEPIDSNGPSVSLIEEQLPSNKNHNTNYKIIPVGANWTENRHIVGYYNVITNEYQSTPAYDLIKEANNSTEPYFLILDEMNLSHVERYFADFLSAIESGEKIPLYGEEELTLPQNLFIIGTVNVDETTYMFSPKVLDRANVIEFETYSASDYMNDNINLSSPSGNIEYLENPLAGNEIRSYGIDELREIFSDVVIDDEPFWDLLSYEINSFQNILSKSGFDFGFRVINEIVRFMAVAWEYERKPSEFDNWTRYFDACIKQKMLPKLHGSEKIIGETLEELSNLCSDSVIGTEDMVKYPESFKKLEEMKKILRKQRYVSFIN